MDKWKMSSYWTITVSLKFYGILHYYTWQVKTFFLHAWFLSHLHSLLRYTNCLELFSDGDDSSAILRISLFSEGLLLEARREQEDGNWGFKFRDWEGWKMANLWCNFVLLEHEELDRKQHAASDWKGHPLSLKGHVELMLSPYQDAAYVKEIIY